MALAKDASSRVSVREATPEDAPHIHALACELADAIGDKYPAEAAVRGRLLELLEEPRARVLVAEGEEGVVGAASFWVKPDLAHGDAVVEVPMLVVSEKSRRQGAGSALMAEIQEMAAANRASIIELIATPQNVAAREFYRTLGFVETDHIALEFVGDLRDPPDPEKT